MERKIVIFVDNDQRLVEIMKDYFSCIKAKKIFCVGAGKAETNLSNIVNQQDTYDKILLITDYRMPYKNGIDLCKEYKDFYSILYSSITEDYNISEALKTGIINKFILKDLKSPKVLRDFIIQFLNS